MSARSAARRLDGFLAEYTPEIIALARAVLAKLRRHLPGAVELVYDNYNGLVIGFGPSDRASAAVFSVVLYPRWVSFFLLDGAALSDPEGLLRGSGKKVRHLVLASAEDLDRPPVRKLMAEALARAGWQPAAGAPGRLVIKSVSAKQRSRRPADRGKRPR